MKKIYILIITLLLTACSSNVEPSNKITELENKIVELEKENKELLEKISELESNTNTSINESSTQVDIRTDYKVGETWEVPGQWKLTVHSAVITEERNEFSDKNPAQVVIVTYDYENLGYESDVQDLYIIPDSAIDENGEMATTYPASTNYPQPTPIGAKSIGAQEAFGLNNESKTIKVIFKEYTKNFDKFEAYFEIPVTTE